MNPLIRNIMAVVGGVAVGSLVNMGLITLSPSIIPPPEGIDPTQVEDIKSVIHLFEPKHYIIPFLAHALGTLVGAFVAAKFSATHHLVCALIVGGYFLLGGVAANMMLGSPTWYWAVDVLFAYIPMAFIGARLAGKRNSSNTTHP